MWTIIGQSGVMTGVVNMTTSFAPVLWGLYWVVALSALGIAVTALREYWAQPSTQQQESMAEERQMAA